MDADDQEIITDPPDLWELAPSIQDIAMAYYRAGTRAGFKDGYAQAEEDMAALQRQAVVAARTAAANSRFSDLANARGDYDRAARARVQEDAIMDAPSPASPGWAPDDGAAQRLDRIRSLPGIGTPVDLSKPSHPHARNRSSAISKAFTSSTR